MRFPALITAVLWLASSILIVVLAKEQRRPNNKHSSPSSSSDCGGGCPAISPILPSPSFTLNNEPYRHYLVGVDNYPNSEVPPILRNISSGGWLNGLGGSPYNYIPGVGYSDMEVFVVDDDDVDRTFWLLSAGGYGFSFNSQDYVLHLSIMRLEITFSYRAGSLDINEFFDPTVHINTILIADPSGFIEWENGADIEVSYRIPDLSWLQLKKDRVLTGRDFQPLGMAVLDDDNKCAIISDGWVPSIFGMDPRWGSVTSPFIRIPEITFYNGTWRFTDKYDDAPVFLSTASDKVHCSDKDLFSLDGCGISDPDAVEKTLNGVFRRVDPGTGFSGLTWLKSGYVVGFLQWSVERYEYGRHEYYGQANSHLKTTKRSRRRLERSGLMEPGARIYLIDPGDCTEYCEPVVKRFIGFYPFEKNADRIGDISALRDDDRKALVVEQKAFPQGNLWPPKKNPASKLCIVDLTSRDPVTWVLTKKKCIMNYYAVHDPYKIGPSKKETYAFSRFNKDAVNAYDDYCVFTGTATDFPFTNDWMITEPYPLFSQLQDPNFMIVCFREPVLDRGFPHFE